MSVECQVNVKSQSELDIGGRETCNSYNGQPEVMIPLSQYGNMFYSVFCRAVEKTRRTTIVISDDDISQLRRRTVVLNPEVSEPVSQTPYVLEC